MKKVAVFILLFMCCNLSFAQYYDRYQDWPTKEEKQAKRAFDKEQKAANWNFALHEGKLYWQKVFEIKPGDEQKARDFFENNIQFQKYGEQYITKLVFSQYISEGTPPNIFYSPGEVIFSVQIKENKYRVTVTDITWVGTVGTVGMITITQQASLTMQDMLEGDGSVLMLKSYGCKHANKAMLQIFDYNSGTNVLKSPNNDLLKQDF